MDNDVLKNRQQLVVKSNVLIQKSRFAFSLQQQKALLFIISQIKPNQKAFEYQKFPLAEFCKICGININGKNYRDVKSSIEGLSSPFWLMDYDENGDVFETMVHFLSNAKVYPRKGIVEIRVDEELKPYLLELQNNFTAFELQNILTMRSKYSIRLYELMRSWSSNETVSYSLDTLSALIDNKYNRWVDTKRKIIEPAIKEINELTDLSVSYEPVKKGRAVVAINFLINKKTTFIEQCEVGRNRHARFNKQK